MKRREFLISAAAATGLAVTGRRAFAQTARSREAKLDRIAMMTLNFTALLKTPHQPQRPERTLDLFDLPQMYVDTYGVRNIELQHYHMASTEPSYFRELRRRMDRAKTKATQLVVEFGGLNISAPDHNFLPRLQAVDLTKVWIDRCVVLGCPRIMVNQGQLSEENRQYAVDTLKLMAEYGKSKGVKVTLETRGGGPAAANAAAALTGAPAQPAWVLLHEVTKAAGAYMNVDFGGVRADSQEALHTALQTMLPTTSGSMHVRNSTPAWDLATALRFLESLGYTGYYSIEARGHEATRAIYDVILDTL